MGCDAKIETYLIMSSFALLYRGLGHFNTNYRGSYFPKGDRAAKVTGFFPHFSFRVFIFSWHVLPKFCPVRFRFAALCRDQAAEGHLSHRPNAGAAHP